jgi:hypothetical protein
MHRAPTHVPPVGPPLTPCVVGGRRERGRHVRRAAGGRREGAMPLEGAPLAPAHVRGQRACTTSARREKKERVSVRLCG